MYCPVRPTLIKPLRDAKRCCFHLPVKRSHLPVNHRLTDQQYIKMVTSIPATGSVDEADQLATNGPEVMVHVRGPRLPASFRRVRVRQVVLAWPRGRVPTRSRALRCMTTLKRTRHCLL